MLSLYEKTLGNFPRVLVGVTRLELATSCTPSKHSSHLSYTPKPCTTIAPVSKLCQAIELRTAILLQMTRLNGLL